MTVKARMPVAKLTAADRRTLALIKNYFSKETAAVSLIATFPDAGVVFIERSGKVFHN